VLIGLAAPGAARKDGAHRAGQDDRRAEKAVTDYKALRGVDMTGPRGRVAARAGARGAGAAIRLHYLNNSALPAA
jgi:hypothetical protein